MNAMVFTNNGRICAQQHYRIQGRIWRHLDSFELRAYKTNNL